MVDINLKELNKFLLDANANGYAGDGNKVKPPQRPGFDEIEYCKGNWLFHDSYAGHYFAPGQEIVYYKNQPVWAMAYAGGMKFQYHEDDKFAKETFSFLKKALLAMNSKKPFRGPEKFEESDWKYQSKVTGDTMDFSGNERIYYKNKLVFEQNFIGGIVVN